MKKLFTLLSVGAIASLTALAAINWNNVDDLAKGATVTVSSNPNDASLIVDDNNGSGWQASAATHEYTHDWVLINLLEPKTFTDIEIVWEASHCKEYSIYLSDTEIPFTKETTDGGVEYNAIDAEWISAHTAAITGGNDTEAGYTENLNFENQQTAQYILIYADEYNNFGSQYGMRIFEVRIADIQNRNEVVSLNVTADGNAVAGGEAINVNIKPVNKIGEEMPLDAITDLALTCNNSNVTIAGGENGIYQVSASKFGEYTLTATAKFGEATVTGTLALNVAYNWTGSENVATGKAIQGRVLASAEDANPPANAVDGNLETYYQYNGEWGGGDSWLLVDLGDVYMVDAIGAYYSTNAGGKCVFGYATDASAVEAVIANGTDFKWENAAEFSTGWTFTNELTRTADVVTTYAYATPVVARYIVVKDADNPQGKPCVNEIYVEGVKREATVATSIEITADNNYVVTGTEITVTANVFDQYGAVMPDQNITLTCDGGTINGDKFTANAVGNYTIKAELNANGTLLSEELTIYVVANADESKLSADNVTKITLNDVEIANTAIFNDYTIPEFPATLKIDLDQYYVFKLIELRWEAACPSDYTVEVTTDKGTYTVLTVEGRKFENGVNPVDKIVNSNYVAPEVATNMGEVAFADLTYVKHITINITGRDHGYNVRLFGIDAYSDADKNTGVDEVTVEANEMTDVYNLQGIRVRSNVKTDEALQGLPRGIYIVNGRKMII